MNFLLFNEKLLTDYEYYYDMDYYSENETTHIKIYT